MLTFGPEPEYAARILALMPAVREDLEQTGGRLTDLFILLAAVAVVCVVIVAVLIRFLGG